MIIRQIVTDRSREGRTVPSAAHSFREPVIAWEILTKALVGIWVDAAVGDVLKVRTGKKVYYLTKKRKSGKTRTTWLKADGFGLGAPVDPPPQLVHEGLPVGKTRKGSAVAGMGPKNWKKQVED